MFEARIMIAGVGGQGSLLASRILGNTAMKLGCDVKVSEVHGMAQRGGSVITYVKMGQKVYSPIIDKGEADYILAFEKLEALRWINYLKKDGVLLVNDQRIDPMPVITGSIDYPVDVIEKLTSSGRNVKILDAIGIAKKCGNARVLNVVMIGALAALTQIDRDIWLEAVRDEVPERFRDININAFKGGYMCEVLESDI